MNKVHPNVYQVVSKIPKGKVLTYKRVAELSKIKNPRVVGSILHKNKDPEAVPCHRVVNSKGYVAGKYAFGGALSQKKRLVKEGVAFINGKVDLARHLWKTPK